jgi:hypothetical protein
MQNITISKKEYNDLLQSKFKFEYISRIFESDLFSTPPTKNPREIIEAFNNEGKYSKTFLKKLETALKRSSFME